MDSWMRSIRSGSSSRPAARYLVGDRVKVFNAARLAEVEETIAIGTIERITTAETGEPQYWVGGVPEPIPARALWLLERGTR